MRVDLVGSVKRDIELTGFGQRQKRDPEFTGQRLGAHGSRDASDIEPLGHTRSESANEGFGGASGSQSKGLTRLDKAQRRFG
jgi:hypothetical protein